MSLQKSDNRTQIWVYPEFSSLLKVAAAQNKTTVIDLTRKISGNPEPLMRLTSDIKEKKKYDFF